MTSLRLSWDDNEVAGPSTPAVPRWHRCLRLQLKGWYLESIRIPTGSSTLTLTTFDNIWQPFGHPFPLGDVSPQQRLQVFGCFKALKRAGSCVEDVLSPSRTKMPPLSAPWNPKSKSHPFTAPTISNLQYHVFSKCLRTSAHPWHHMVNFNTTEIAKNTVDKSWSLVHGASLFLQAMPMQGGHLTSLTCLVSSNALHSRHDTHCGWRGTTRDDQGQRRMRTKVEDDPDSSFRHDYHNISQLTLTNDF